jgi:hypothetical protein
MIRSAERRIRSRAMSLLKQTNRAGKHAATSMRRVPSISAIPPASHIEQPPPVSNGVSLRNPPAERPVSTDERALPRTGRSPTIGSSPEIHKMRSASLIPGTIDRCRCTGRLGCSSRRRDQGLQHAGSPLRALLRRRNPILACKSSEGSHHKLLSPTLARSRTQRRRRRAGPASHPADSLGGRERGGARNGCWLTAAWGTSRSFGSSRGCQVEATLKSGRAVTTGTGALQRHRVLPMGVGVRTALYRSSALTRSAYWRLVRRRVRSRSSTT